MTKKRKTKGQKIFELQKELRNVREDHESEINELRSKQNASLAAKREKIDELNERINGLESEVKEKNDQIKTMELKRFALAYADQENEYGEERRKWFLYSLIATGLLTASVLFSILSGEFLDVSGEWYQQPGFYLLNAIFVTIFAYSLKQHAHFGHLRVDYANRKTLAQSYQHIIEDEEDEEIKIRFLNRAADVFTSPADLRSAEVSLYESFLNKIFNKGENK